MYNIVPIFIIYPALIFLLYRKRCGKISKLVIFLSFVFLFIMTKSGPDYLAYSGIYNQVNEGVPFGDIHGEVLFLAIMRLFGLMNLSYDVFRVVFLTVSLAIFCFFVNKMSPKFGLSFFYLMTGYITYLLSAYRQLMVMAIMMMSLYLILFKNKYFLAIVLSVLALLFHNTGIVILAFSIFSFIFRKNSEINSNLSNAFIKNSRWLMLIAICLLLRVVMYFVANAIKFNLFSVYSEVSLFSTGLLSRTVGLIFVTQGYKSIKPDKVTSGLYLIYLISILLYILFPFELLMGRLTNCGRALDIILIPLIFYRTQSSDVSMLTDCNTISGRKHLLMKNYRAKYMYIAMTIIYSVVYVTQLLVQNGYEVYMHMFFS